MPRFAPNLMHMFQELDERDRVPAAAELGFDAVEWIFPYALKKEEVARICKDNGVTISYGLGPAATTAGLAGPAARSNSAAPPTPPSSTRSLPATTPSRSDMA